MSPSLAITIKFTKSMGKATQEYADDWIQIMKSMGFHSFEAGYQNDWTHSYSCKYKEHEFGIVFQPHKHSGFYISDYVPHIVERKKIMSVNGLRKLVNQLEKL
jgi:hypothetical protein